MRRLYPPERTVAHIVTGLVAVLVAATVTISPLKWSHDLSEVPQAAAAMDNVLPSDPDLVMESPLTFRAAIAARGGQRDVQPALPPTATATATAAPTSTPPPPAPPATATRAEPEKAPAVQIKARVGLQAGHWKNAELPAELASLRGSTGAAGNGWREVDINLDISKRVAALLEKQGVTVDLIPATVPVRYKADAFVAIHADANSNTGISGYKLARASWSKNPTMDDALLRAISSTYGSATGLRTHAGSITGNMTGYYAFNQGLQHAVDSSTAAVILELGFLTTAGDLRLIREQPDRVAEGVANGIAGFLINR